MEALVVRVDFVQIWLIIIIFNVLFFDSVFDLLLSCFFLRIELLFLLFISRVFDADSFLVRVLSTRILDNSSPPLTSEDQRIPQSDSLHCVEEGEPELEFLMRSEGFSPHFEQKIVDSVVSFITPF